MQGSAWFFSFLLGSPRVKWLRIPILEPAMAKPEGRTCVCSAGGQRGSTFDQTQHKEVTFAHQDLYLQCLISIPNPPVREAFMLSAALEPHCLDSNPGSPAC